MLIQTLNIEIELLKKELSKSRCLKMDTPEYDDDDSTPHRDPWMAIASALGLAGVRLGSFKVAVAAYSYR